MNTKPLTPPQSLTVLIADDMSRVNLDAVKRAVAMFESVHGCPVVLSPLLSPPPIPLEFVGLPQSRSLDFDMRSRAITWLPDGDYIRRLDIEWDNDDTRRNKRNKRKQRSRTRRGK